MYARVATFEGGDPERLRQMSEERANSGTMEMPAGLKSAMVLQGSSKRLFMTFFDSKDQVDAAEEQFDKMGDEIPEDVRGRRTGVDVYEVVWEQDA